MFESGAIVMHIAEQSPRCCPLTPRAARACALDVRRAESVEPHVQNLVAIDLFNANEEWARLRRPAAEKSRWRVSTGVASALAGRDYLVDAFTVADLLMCTVLRFLRHTKRSMTPGAGPVQGALEARPAFKRALDAQLANFVKYAPAA